MVAWELMGGKKITWDLGGFFASETEDVFNVNVKDVRKYIYIPGVAVLSEYTEQRLCSPPVQGHGGQHMEMSFIQEP